MEKNAKKERFIWIDVLNICACISVIFLHCTNNQVHHFDGCFDIPYYIGMISHSFALWGVPIFIMISGHNLLGYKGDWKHFYKRRFIRAVVPFVLWSLFYFLLFVHHPIPVSDFIERFLAGKFNGHMWFFVPLFSLYLSMPFLATFVQNSSERKLKAFVLISFIFVSLIPFLFSIVDIHCWERMFPMGINYFIYAVLGYIIPRIELFSKQKKIFYALGFGGAVASLIALITLTHEGSIFFKQFLLYVNPFNFFISIAVFIFFQNLKLNKLLDYRGLIQKVSSCSLGIYLFHATILAISNKFDLGLSNPYFGFILVYLTSLFVILVMKKIKFLNIMVP